MLPQQGLIYRFYEYTVDPLARTLKRNEEDVALTRRSFDLLLYLVQNSGKILNKDELLKQIWPDTFVDENSLAKSVSVLRKALDDASVERSFILTLTGRGYQFAAPVQVAGLASDTSPALEAVGSESQAIGVLRERRTIRTNISEFQQDRSRLTAQGWIAVSSLVLLTLGAIGGGGFLLWKQLHPAPLSASVVLADFENLTGDKGFDIAINRAFQIDLEQSPFLDILPRTTVGETLAQMQHKADEPLTPELAREVCERNNAQAVISGSISEFAGKYLLLVDARSWVNGKSVAGYKQVSSKGDVLAALDAGAGRVRKQLGESAASLEKFQTPIAQATTSSLEALRAYTQGLEASDRGDIAAEKALFERAIALDPNFASAYKELSISFHDRGDFVQAVPLIQKAYDLRAATTERERLSIEIAYNLYASLDYEAAVTSMRLYNTIYPNNASNWFTLSSTYSKLGQIRQAIDAGEYAYRLAPHSGTAAETLAGAYKRANRFADAKRLAEATIAEGKDRWGMHSILLQIAFIEHDTARIKAEGEWGISHGVMGPALTDLGFVAASEGKLRETTNDFSRARQEGLRNGDTDFADDATMFLAGIQIEDGYPREAAASLRQMNSDAIDAGTTALFNADLGDVGPAQRLVAKMSGSGTRNTLDLYFNLPELRALLALKAHRPAEAVQELEPARKYQMRDIGVPYQRARAEAEAGMLDQAAQDYRLILANPGINTIWPDRSLAHLQLARVLVLQQKQDEARAEYRAFFDLWKDADPQVPLLVQAKYEFAKLNAR
jgi:DNA-binding winged helix-turn-helix (wHTH) protein/Flp pilus assembly protein TadD/predicted negative regulator of RcsB-dependent stress response